MTASIRSGDSAERVPGSASADAGTNRFEGIKLCPVWNTGTLPLLKCTKLAYIAVFTINLGGSTNLLPRLLTQLLSALVFLCTVHPSIDRNSALVELSYTFTGAAAI